MLCVYRDRKLLLSITRMMYLWERGLHDVLLGHVEAKGASRDYMDVSGGEEENKTKDQKYHSADLSVKLRQAIRRETNMRGGGCLSLYDLCTKNE